MRTFNIKVSKYFQVPTNIQEVLQKVTSLDPKILGDAASKGALWYQKGGKGKTLRTRSMQLMTNPDDSLTFYYDPHVLAMPRLEDAICLHQTPNYGIWIKAAGVLPQGTQYSDHTSLLRYVEREKKKEIFLIHRLDRETEGLMILGYNRVAAAKLSDLFQKNKIQKTYEAIVLGEMPLNETATIDKPLEGKDSITHYEVLEVKNGMSLLKLKIDTGRLHQIRRHLEMIGHPIMGDSKYGRGNKNKDGLKLLSTELSFEEPWEQNIIKFSLDKHLSI